MKKIRQIANRTLSLFLAFTMLCTVQDMTVFAQTATITPELEEELRDRTFQTIDGETQKMYSESYELTIEVFISTGCGWSKKALQYLRDMKLPEDKVDIFCIEVDCASKEDVQSLAKQLNTPGITYCYDTEIISNNKTQAYNDLKSYTDYYGDGVVGTPEYVVRDKTGKVLNWTGGWREPKEFAAIIESIGYAHVLPEDLKSGIEAEFDVTYNQSESRQMLSRINEFRTGDDAWEWNETDTGKIVHTDLGELTYDYELEKVAMQRAAELVAAYSHTRPNGQPCFSAYPSAFNISNQGENIAIGTGSLTEETVFTAWREEDEPYSGQGHRRNMLSQNFTTIGIAHVTYNGCHYWVQEFGSILVGDAETTANNDKTTVKVMISKDIVSEQTLKPEVKAVVMKVGESQTLPQINNAVRTNETWRSAPSLEFTVNAEWSVAIGDKVVSISEGKLHALKEGETEVTASYNGEEIKIPVTVTQGSTEDLDPAVILGQAKNDAIEKLESYVKELQAKNQYSSTAVGEMTFIIADARTNLDTATDTARVEFIFDWSKERLDGVTPEKTFDEIKQAAKEELSSYQSDQKETSEQKSQWEKIITDTQTTIDDAADRTSVNTALTRAKSLIDRIVAGEVITDDELNLDQKRAEAFRDLESYYQNINKDDYEYGEASWLADVFAQARYDIYNTAKNAQELESIVKNAKEEFDKTLTKEEKKQQQDQAEKALNAAKEAAVAKLNKYLENLNDYSSSQQKELKKLVENGIWDINHASSKSVMDKKLSDAEVKIKEKIEGYDKLNKSLLATAKSKAKKELQTYKDASNYRTAQQRELEKAIKEGEATIDAAKNKAGVETALKNAKAKIDKIKTDAQLKKEEGGKTGSPAKTSISGKIKAQKKGFTVKWKKQTKNVDGYEVCYSTSRKFPKKGTVTKTVSKNTTTKLTVKKLKAKKIYYIKVRTYKKVNGKKSVSAWSAVKTVKTKK